MKIGVFDSGVGGLAVANAIQNAMPELDIVVRQDKEHLPYGTKPPQEVMGYVVPIFEEMIKAGCKVIVVACNTVSTTLITELRERFPKTPLIAMEPMVKPAAERTKTGIVAVCATPATLESERYKWLKDTFAQGITVLEPDCADWSSMIEDQDIKGQEIALRIEEVLKKKADVIVLGCTHYHWIETEIKTLAAGRAKVLQPEQAIIRQLQRVLGQLS